MSSGREDVRLILVEMADSIRREQDPIARIGLTDEFVKVALQQATDLRDSTCYLLMEAGVSHHTYAAAPAWVERRAVYARRWATRHGLSTHWHPGRPRQEGPPEYVAITLPD